jgi:hypothetical protein
MFDHEERKELAEIRRGVREILHILRPELATSISFTQQGDPMALLPVQAGNTLVYTGTLSPAGSVFAPDAVVDVTANDPAILPTVDSTGLIVSVPLPAGWVESTATPLVISYSTTSASTSQALSASITPGAEVTPPVLASSISFVQTT